MVSTPRGTPTRSAAAAEDAASLEAAAVARILDGEPAEYRTLVELHHRRIYAIVHRMTGNPADAEDLTQQAFLAAYHALDDFDPSRSFGTWINRIAVNLAKDHCKSKKRTESSIEDAPVSTEACFSAKIADPEQAATDGERHALLVRALAALQSNDREVLVLKDLEELSYEEMRGVLGRPVTALKIRVVRARQRLRALLDRWGVRDV